MIDITTYNKFQISLNKKFGKLENIRKSTSNNQNNLQNFNNFEYFIGRKEQIQLINKSINKKKIIHIMGIEGIGKSELCRYLYYQHAYAYATSKNILGQPMPIYMRYEYNLDDTIMRIVSVDSNISYTDSVNKVWDYLSILSKHKKLLIFLDGVDKSLTEDKSLNKLFKLNCTSIVTSVNNIFHNSPDLCKIKLGSLSNDESIDLFKYVYVNNIPDEDNKKLLHIVKEIADNHPLTINILASLARINDWNVSELVQYLEDSKFKISGVFISSDNFNLLIDEYKKTLLLMDFDDTERNILEAFSLLPPDYYSIEFCHEWLNKDYNLEDFTSILDELCLTGWIYKDTKTMTYSMSTVVATVIKNIYPADITNHLNLVKVCDKYLQKYLSNTYNSDYTYWQIAENLINNLYDESVYQLGRIVMNAGRIVLKRMEYERARSLLRRAVVIFENTISREHIETAEAYIHLALTYEKLNDYYNALLHYNVALEIQDSILDLKEHDLTANTYISIGNVYVLTGEYEKSMPYFSKGLDIALKIHGKEHLSIATLYECMANVLYNMNDNNKSLRYYNLALEIKLNMNNQNDSIADIYVSLAHIYRRMSKYNDSIKYFKKAIDIYEKLYGKKHLSISYAYNGIAGTFARMGKQEKAIFYSNKSIDICESLYGKKSMPIATAYNTMALVYKYTKDYDIAIKYFTLSLNIVEQIKGKDSIYSAHLYKGIAGIFKIQKKYSEALGYYIKAKDIRTKYLGEKHSDTLYIIHKIENTRKAIEHSKAIKLLTDIDV